MVTQTTTVRPNTAPTPDPGRVSPEPVMRLASGFVAAKHLFAASEFEALGDTPATIDGLAARTGLPVRTARISADALLAGEFAVHIRDGRRQRRGGPPVAGGGRLEVR